MTPPNYCTKCACYFTAPGSCNCYAAAKTAPNVVGPIITTTPPKFTREDAERIAQAVAAQQGLAADAALRCI